MVAARRTDQPSTGQIDNKWAWGYSDIENYYRYEGTGYDLINGRLLKKLPHTPITLVSILYNSSLQLHYSRLILTSWRFWTGHIISTNKSITCFYESLWKTSCA